MVHIQTPTCCTPTVSYELWPAADVCDHSLWLAAHVSNAMYGGNTLHDVPHAAKCYAPFAVMCSRPYLPVSAQHREACASSSLTALYRTLMAS